MSGNSVISHTRIITLFTRNSSVTYSFEVCLNTIMFRVPRTMKSSPLSPCPHFSKFYLTTSPPPLRDILYGHGRRCAERITHSLMNSFIIRSVVPGGGLVTVTPALRHDRGLLIILFSHRVQWAFWPNALPLWNMEGIVYPV